MNKSDLARVLAEKNDISVKNAKMAVDKIFEIMCESLLRGQKIEIRGFGSLSIREYGAYTRRNPRTGELIDVKEKKNAFFKTGKDLKIRLNAGSDEVAE
ncbi:HU family DNA-binding protein [Thermodesulfobacteriota bacterium]